MKFLRSISIAFAIATVTATSAFACSRPKVAGTEYAIPASGKISQALLDRAVLIEVNYTRCRAGLAPLKGETRLVRAASKHSRWMAKSRKLSHRSSLAGQSSPSARIKGTGLKFRTGSENISRMYRYQLAGKQFFVKDASRCQFADAKGRPIQPHSYATLARAAVRLWAESPSHRKNLMDGNMRLTGAAAALDKSGKYCGSIYLTQNFMG
ncbi:CAP domain-containing protein [Falsihalocynthiibacter sp. SS001]|uniref:CAP domain-containing protein n=1 Tax=Falsihalocynthiibacter sp. SS001 TaxID=3349698 RepID=UPI0036D39A99